VRVQRVRAYYSIAKDGVGNTEEAPVEPEAETTVTSEARLHWRIQGTKLELLSRNPPPPPHLGRDLRTDLATGLPTRRQDNPGCTCIKDQTS
jgi:hypothetical protein